MQGFNIKISLFFWLGSSSFAQYWSKSLHFECFLIYPEAYFTHQTPFFGFTKLDYGYNIYGIKAKWYAIGHKCVILSINHLLYSSSHMPFVLSHVLLVLSHMLYVISHMLYLISHMLYLISHMI